jgi:hypothetical protein
MSEPTVITPVIFCFGNVTNVGHEHGPYSKHCINSVHQLHMHTVYSNEFVLSPASVSGIHYKKNTLCNFLSLRPVVPKLCSAVHQGIRDQILGEPWIYSCNDFFEVYLF